LTGMTGSAPRPPARGKVAHFMKCAIMPGDVPCSNVIKMADWFHRATPRRDGGNCHLLAHDRCMPLLSVMSGGRYDQPALHRMSGPAIQASWRRIAHFMKCAIVSKRRFSPTRRICLLILREGRIPHFMKCGILLVCAAWGKSLLQKECTNTLGRIIRLVRSATPCPYQPCAWRTACLPPKDELRS